MLISLVSQYLQSHKRLVVPQLGAFIVKQPGRSVLFSELLKRDDGVLRGLMVAAGIGELEAAGEIDRFVFEVRHAVEHGREYPLEGFGVMKPGPNGTIAFAFEPCPEPAAAGDESVTRSESAGKGDPEAGSKARSGAETNDGTKTDGAVENTSGAGAGTRTGMQTADVPADRHEAGTATPGEVGARQPAQSAAKQTYVEPRISPSAKMNPEPYVRGLRYGKPRKSTDAYRYVDAAPRRRTDRFLIVAVVAALVAVAAIAFGYYREARERRAEAEFIEQLQTPAPQPAQPQSQSNLPSK